MLLYYITVALSYNRFTNYCVRQCGVPLKGQLLILVYMSDLPNNSFNSDSIFLFMASYTLLIISF